MEHSSHTFHHHQHSSSNIDNSHHFHIRKSKTGFLLILLLLLLDLIFVSKSGYFAIKKLLFQRVFKLWALFLFTLNFIPILLVSYSLLKRRTFTQWRYRVIVIISIVDIVNILYLSFRRFRQDVLMSFIIHFLIAAIYGIPVEYRISKWLHPIFKTHLLETKTIMNRKSISTPIFIIGKSLSNPTFQSHSILPSFSPSNPLNIENRHESNEKNLKMKQEEKMENETRRKDVIIEEINNLEKFPSSSLSSSSSIISTNYAIGTDPIINFPPAHHGQSQSMSISTFIEKPRIKTPEIITNVDNEIMNLEGNGREDGESSKSSWVMSRKNSFKKHL